MLTKILVTALVILTCFYYLRYQRNKQQTGTQKENAATSTREFSLTSQIKWLASGLVVLTICTAIVLFIYGWFDKQQVLNVKVTSPYSGKVVSYQVYKGDINERSFETVQGHKIQIGNSERIEIREQSDDQ
jgi:protein-S-isoprenylcysteine O-methyltransferase Ste14